MAPTRSSLALVTSFSSLTGFRSDCANVSHTDLDKTVDSLKTF